MMVTMLDESMMKKSLWKIKALLSESKCGCNIKPGVSKALNRPGVLLCRGFSPIE
jgi:hypothetical protein